MAPGEDFSYAAPSKAQSDPGSLDTPRSGEYPRHVHKWAGEEADGSPKLNLWREVKTPTEHQQALAEGWSDDIQLHAPEGSDEGNESAPKRKR